MRLLFSEVLSSIIDGGLARTCVSHSDEEVQEGMPGHIKPSPAHLWDVGNVPLIRASLKKPRGRQEEAKSSHSGAMGGSRRDCD